MYYYIVYSSITHATRVKNYFNNEAGFVSVMHTPANIPVGGCSYSLKLRKDKLYRAIDISNQIRAKLLGVFVEQDNKTFVEVMP